MILGRTRRSVGAPALFGLGALVATLVTGAGCGGHRSVGNTPDSGSRGDTTGSGPDAGTTETGPDAASHGGSSIISDFPQCAPSATTGSACVEGSSPCVRPPRCVSCIGGYYRLMPDVTICQCRSGSLNCVSPSAGPSTGDCFVDTPVSCDDAKDAYADPECTQHPDCT